MCSGQQQKGYKQSSRTTRLPSQGTWEREGGKYGATFLVDFFLLLPFFFILGPTPGRTPGAEALFGN